MFRMLFIPQFMLAYVILSIIVGLCGRNKYLGFWGFLLLSLLWTPVVMGVILLVTRSSSLRCPLTRASRDPAIR